MQKILRFSLCFFLIVSLSFTALAQERQRRGDGQGGRGGQADRGDYFTYSVSPSKALKCNLFQRVQSLPEWNVFFNTLTSKIDAQYVAASNLPIFPSDLADDLLDKLRDATGKRNVTSKDVLGLFFEQTDLVQLEINAKKAYDSGAESIPKFTTLSFVFKFNPAELSCVLDPLTEGTHYRFIKSDPDNFLIAFTLPFNQQKVYVQGVKLAKHNRYALVISGDQALVERKVGQFQNSDRLIQLALDDKSPIETIRIGSGVIGILKAEVQNRLNLDAGQRSMLKVLDGIESIRITTGDESNRTLTRVELQMTNAEAAQKLRGLAEMGIAGLDFIRNSDIDPLAKKGIDFLSTADARETERGFVVELNCSQRAFTDLVAAFLKAATEKIK